MLKYLLQYTILGYTKSTRTDQYFSNLFHIAFDEAVNPLAQAILVDTWLPPE